MKKQSTASIFLATALILLGILCSNLNVDAQSVSQHQSREDAERAAGKGITFKTPDNFTPIEKWTDFKGVLLINLKQPAGVFASYPNDGESIEQLMNRVRAYVVPMFVHDKSVKFDWQTSPLSLREADKVGRMDVYINDKQTVQVAFYQRERNGAPYIYGYFSMKNVKEKAKGVWLGDDGKGVKEFDKFWKSLPKE